MLNGKYDPHIIIFIVSQVLIEPVIWMTDHKSTARYAIFLGKNPLAWNFTK